MRTRKPWVFLRRRLFGWNVLFIAGAFLGSTGSWDEEVRPSGREGRPAGMGLARHVTKMKMGSADGMPRGERRADESDAPGRGAESVKSPRPQALGTRAPMVSQR